MSLNYRASHAYVWFIFLICRLIQSCVSDVKSFVLISLSHWVTLKSDGTTCRTTGQ